MQYNNQGEIKNENLCDTGTLTNVFNLIKNINLVMSLSSSFIIPACLIDADVFFLDSETSTSTQ